MLSSLRSMFGGAANNHPHPYAANVHPRGCAGHPKVHVLCSLVGRTLTPTLAPAVSIVALAENALQFKFHARLAWRPPKPPESAASTVAPVAGLPTIQVLCPVGLARFVIQVLEVGGVHPSAYCRAPNYSRSTSSGLTSHASPRTGGVNGRAIC